LTDNKEVFDVTDQTETGVRLETHGTVSVISIDRPERRNALSLAAKAAIADAVESIGNDSSSRAIVLTGSPKYFVSGTDVAEMVDFSPTDHVLQATDRMFTAIRATKLPVIAAVEGYALGGGSELALSCDLIVAGEGAVFGQPEILLGVMPGAGATQRMVRTIGKYRTLELLLTGRRFDAREAAALGLVSRVVADGSALAEALALADKIASLPPLAVRAILDVVAVGEDAPLETALLLERKSFQLLFDSHDQQEGMRAFLEKRAATFEGR
jgi:enoyl-CoA hydratase